MQDSVEYREQVPSSSNNNSALNRQRGDNRYSMEVLNRMDNLNDQADTTFVNSVQTSQQHYLASSFKNPEPAIHSMTINV